MCVLILVVSYNRCHGLVGVDADEAVTLPVLNLIDGLVDKLNLHELPVQCAGGGVISLSRSWRDWRWKLDAGSGLVPKSEGLRMSRILWPSELPALMSSWQMAIGTAM